MLEGSRQIKYQTACPIKTMKYPVILKPATRSRPNSLNGSGILFRIEYGHQEISLAKALPFLPETLATSRTLRVCPISATGTRVVNPKIVFVTPEHLVGVAR